MNENRFPPGWDEERVKMVLMHFEEQTEEEAVAEDEAALEDRTQTVMEVPTALVPAIRELPAKHETETSGVTPIGVNLTTCRAIGCSALASRC